MSISLLLIQFVFRVTFGVALAMSCTPSRWVSSGFYRVHLWVLMGLNTLASLVAFTQGESLQQKLAYETALLPLAICVAVLCYVGSVMWLYEKNRVGLATTLLIASTSLVAGVLSLPSFGDADFGSALRVADVASGGLVLGVTLSAMFLGHWYLNTPTMQLSPLKRLIQLMMIALVVRALVCAVGLVLQSQGMPSWQTSFGIFVALRWLSGLAAPLILAIMTWYTLKIPNTQSATGILYAGVILTFIGELTSQFLSAEAAYPL